jgi:hypothetical protein
VTPSAVLKKQPMVEISKEQNHDIFSTSLSAVHKKTKTKIKKNMLFFPFPSIFSLTL